MNWLLALLRNLRLLPYLLASIGALALDIACFLSLMQIGLDPAPASAAGYSFGILAHWLLSSRTVFTDNVADGGFERWRQKALFVVSAFIGLLLTTLIVGSADNAGFDPRLAKLIAVFVSFTATWLLRALVVFRAPALDRRAG
ncbi:hypothetical protein HME9302_02470 [Alteripontixanthobacter maritimus]|uniref:GtrA/DPMS transmembrane domain-containing protein n=1 Tax=Alteripontixanthobacter maritimus TaxID=2161824 RepID=A0A369QEB5_9SPHN|nr:GtrA family protein [Alteripontixanthobacter maritimus]RDC61249.1 hypothetical protein HME9302_02470 [Alteripontixanthobacter maritimus]